MDEWGDLAFTNDANGRPADRPMILDNALPVIVTNHPDLRGQEWVQHTWEEWIPRDV